LADAFYEVPLANSVGYVAKMLEIARCEHVDVILPQTTAETQVLATCRQIFRRAGFAVATSSGTAVARANDKYKLLVVARDLMIPCPEWFLVSNVHELYEAAHKLGYPKKPVVVKPRVSHGGRGFRVLTEKPWSMVRFFSKKPSVAEMTLDQLRAVLAKRPWPRDMLVQQFLPGTEFSIDCFRGRHGFIAIPRIREKVCSGITMSARVTMREDLIGYCGQLAKELDLVGAFGFQFKLGKWGVPRILECNPRVQTGMIAARASGMDVIWAAVLESLGERVQLDSVALREVAMRRYWGAVCSYGNDVVERI